MAARAGVLEPSWRATACGRTGLARPIVKALVLHLIARCRELELPARPGAEAESLARFSILVTTLAMNRVYTGKFGEL